jgi:hypothetical protein
VVAVQANTCSDPIPVTEAAVVVTEVKVPQTVVSNITATPADQLVRVDLRSGLGVVTVPRGGETTITFTNATLG